MSNRPLQLGPDPNRTYLERWNEIHPDRYGRPDAYDEAESAWWQRNTTSAPEDGGTSGSFLESLLSLVILILAPIIGLFVTLPLYQWTRPDSLTPGWIIGYTVAFVVATFAGAMLVYALRRVLFIFALAALTFGIGYAAWHLWIT